MIQRVFLERETKSMSSLKVHTIQSVVTSAALYPVMGENVIPFGLAVVFIDLDHVIEYVRDTGSLDVRGVFTCSKLIEKNVHKKFLVINIFHTVEFFLMVLLLAKSFPWLYYVLAGMLYHMLFDLMHVVRNRTPFARAYSNIEYLYRRSISKYITSVKDLFAMEDLNTSGVKNIEYWFWKWGIEPNKEIH